NAERLRGIILTHGHEDHVGAIPYLLREFKTPVYGTRLTLGLVESKLQDFGIKNADLREVGAGEKFSFGGFNVEFINVNHSIPGAVAVALR
ncbi:MBL fold metallo-hydrolase, partial [Escherichia coli]|nr:MBL fold metallo-hydrolase [Escherichia coli]